MWMLTLVLEEQGKEGLEEGSLVGIGMGPNAVKSGSCRVEGGSGKEKIWGMVIPTLTECW